MTVYEFSLKSETRIFSGGADPQKAELRPSALLGPMRFWFRAMMGTIVGDNLSELRRLEGIAFGQTDVAAPFALRLTPNTVRTVNAGMAETLSAGYGYLAFSCYDEPVGRQRKLRRGCIEPGSTYHLTLRFRTAPSLRHEVVLYSLWLLLHLGAVGARSRRGFGVLSASNPGPGMEHFAPPKDVALHYRTALKGIAVLFARFAQDMGLTHTPQAVTQYPTLRNWCGRIMVRQNITALARWYNHWGIVLRGFRNEGYLGNPASSDQSSWRPPNVLRQEFNQSTRDFKDVIAPWMDREVPQQDKPDNAVFGLPLVFMSPKRNKRQLTLEWKKKGGQVPQESVTSLEDGTNVAAAQEKGDLQGNETLTEGRRASPFALRPIRLADGRLGTLLTCFVSQFLPGNASMALPPWTDNDEPFSLKIPTDDDISVRAAQLFAYIDRFYQPQPDAPGDLLVPLSSSIFP